jgi:hypothetical protein
MKDIIPNVGNRLTYTFQSMSVPTKVPEQAVKHKLNRDRAFELELFSQSEMRKLRNDFYFQLRRRGVNVRKKKIDEAFQRLMKSVAGKIDTSDIQKKGVGHVIGEDRHFGDGRDSQEWFYVVDWPSGNEVREHFEFEKADFHITLGLTGNGVNEFRKDETTLLDDQEMKNQNSNLSNLFKQDDDNG